MQGHIHWQWIIPCPLEKKLWKQQGLKYSWSIWLHGLCWIIAQAQNVRIHWVLLVKTAYQYRQNMVLKSCEEIWKLRTRKQMLYSIHIAKQSGNVQNFKVICDDTDIFLLLLYYYVTQKRVTYSWSLWKTDDHWYPLKRRLRDMGPLHFVYQQCML